MSHTPENTPIDIAAIDAQLHAQDAEKLQIQETMQARLAAMPPTFSYSEYIALCDEVGTPGGETGLYPQGINLFSLNALTALPRIFPEIRPVHFALNITENALEMIDPQGITHLPQKVNGVPIEEVVGYVANGIPVFAGDDGQPLTDHIATADGQCTTTSLRGLKQLVRAHESIRPYALIKRIEPAYRRSIQGEYFYPGLTPLSYGHTIIGIPFVADDTPMELLIDATIAQTDRTQEYDMEVTTVPQTQVPNYLRLRYSSDPNGSIRTKHP